MSDYYPQTVATPISDIEIATILADTEREVETETCLEDDEYILDADLYYNEVVPKKRCYLNA